MMEHMTLNLRQQKNTTGDEMINISSIYPRKEGYSFDFDYYLISGSIR